MYGIVFLAGFLTGIIYVVADTVDYVVFMKMSELETENENLRTKVEMLEDELGRNGKESTQS